MSYKFHSQKKSLEVLDDWLGPKNRVSGIDLYWILSPKFDETLFAKK